MRVRQASLAGVGLRLVDGDDQWRIQVLSRENFLNFKSKNGVHFVHFYALILKFAGFLYMQKKRLQQKQFLTTLERQ